MATVMQFMLVAGVLGMVGYGTVSYVISISEEQGNKHLEAVAQTISAPEDFYHVAKKWEVERAFEPDRKLLLTGPQGETKIVKVPKGDYDAISEGSNICMDGKGNIYATHDSSCQHTDI